MSTPSTSAPRLAAGSAVVPSPHPRSRTLSPRVIPSDLTRASPLSRMLSAMRVKSPFSQSALFGFMDWILRSFPPSSSTITWGPHLDRGPRGPHLARAHRSELIDRPAVPALGGPPDPPSRRLFHEANDQGVPGSGPAECGYRHRHRRHAEHLQHRGEPRPLHRRG